jgi:hypothetical protein
MVKANKADVPTAACLTLGSVTAQTDQLSAEIMTTFIIHLIEILWELRTEEEEIVEHPIHNTIK